MTLAGTVDTLSNTPVPLVIVPMNDPMFVFGGFITCLMGAVSSMTLATAALRIGLVPIQILTAITFGMQAVFALHFIAMDGIILGIEWVCLW